MNILIWKTDRSYATGASNGRCYRLIAWKRPPEKDLVVWIVWASCSVVCLLHIPSLSLSLFCTLLNPVHTLVTAQILAAMQRSRARNRRRTPSRRRRLSSPSTYPLLILSMPPTGILFGCVTSTGWWWCSLVCCFFGVFCCCCSFLQIKGCFTNVNLFCTCPVL